MFIAALWIRHSIFTASSGVTDSLSVPDAERLERNVATTIRGPFGATLVAAEASQLPSIREQLEGFALQFAPLKSPKHSPLGALGEILTAATAVRERWQRAMAAAGQRFRKPAPPPQGKRRSGPPPKADDEVGTPAWGALKSDPDVKIRGMAKSFDRDGIYIIDAESDSLSLENMAAWIEQFAGGAASQNDCLFARKDGRPAWPLLLDANLHGALKAAPPSTDPLAWAAGLPRAKAMDSAAQ